MSQCQRIYIYIYHRSISISKELPMQCRTWRPGNPRRTTWNPPRWRRPSRSWSRWGAEEIFPFFSGKNGNVKGENGWTWEKQTALMGLMGLMAIVMVSFCNYGNLNGKRWWFDPLERWVFWHHGTIPGRGLASGTIAVAWNIPQLAQFCKATAGSRVPFRLQGSVPVFRVNQKNKKAALPEPEIFQANSYCCWELE